MRLAKRVEARGLQEAVFRDDRAGRSAVDAAALHARRTLLILGDRLFAAAGIAREGRGAELRVGADDARGNEGRDKRDEAARMAAGVGNALGGNDALAQAAHLGETVGPAGSGAVRGGGVDDDRAGVLHKRDRLDGGGVGQAEEGDVGRVERLGTSGRVFAQLIGHAEQLDVGTAREPVVDAQTGGARLAVDEDLRHVLVLPALDAR